MSRAGGVRVARVLGVDVLVRPSLVLMGAALAVLLVPRLDAAGVEQPVLVGVLLVVSIYLSVLLHELAHVVAARSYAMEVESVTLHLLGGETLVVGESRTPTQELITAGSGPVISGLLGSGCLLLTDGQDAGTVSQLLWALGWINLLVAATNLLPALPLDGGRVLRAIVWAVTGRESLGVVVAAWIGRLAALACLVVGVVLVVRGDRTAWLDLAVLGLVAVFLWQGSGQALRFADRSARIDGLEAARLADRGVAPDDPDAADLPRLSSDLRGTALLRAMTRVPSDRYAVVDDDGTVRGVLYARTVDRAFRTGGRR